MPADDSEQPTPLDLDVLPDGTIIRDADGDFWRANPWSTYDAKFDTHRLWHSGWGDAADHDLGRPANEIPMPATVIYQPESSDGSMRDERLADVKPGQVFSFPESAMPAARFVRIGDDFAVITQDGGLIGYPERQFALYAGPVCVHEEDWPTAHAIRMEGLTDA